MARALIVVDVQNDFCEGGSLPVTGGARVAAGIHDLLQRWHSHADDRPAYDVVVATKDHHVDPGHHWSVKPDFAESWPVHCKVGTEGAAFHPNLDPQPFDEVFFKGEHQAAYSGFEGRTSSGTALADWLRERHVADVDAPAWRSPERTVAQHHFSVTVRSTFTVRAVPWPSAVSSLEASSLDVWMLPSSST